MNESATIFATQWDNNGMSGKFLKGDNLAVHIVVKQKLTIDKNGKSLLKHVKRSY